MQLQKGTTEEIRGQGNHDFPGARGGKTAGQVPVSRFLLEPKLHTVKAHLRRAKAVGGRRVMDPKDQW